VVARLKIIRLPAKPSQGFVALRMNKVADLGLHEVAGDLGGNGEKAAVADRGYFLDLLKCATRVAKSFQPGNDFASIITPLSAPLASI
jgi:hypothetical protein